MVIKARTGQVRLEESAQPAQPVIVPFGAQLSGLFDLTWVQFSVTDSKL